MTTQPRSFIKLFNIKITIPIDESTLPFFKSYATFKSYIQSLTPELKISTIKFIHTPWHRNPWQHTDGLFRAKHKKMRFEILTYALATKSLTILAHHMTSLKLDGTPKPETLPPYTTINLTTTPPEIK